MINQGKQINIANYFFMSFVVAAIYYGMHTTGYYDTSLRIMAAIGLIPAICMGLILYKTKELQFGVYFLILYQTWNMFLEPYTWKQPVESIYRSYHESDFPEMGFYCMLSIYTLFFGIIKGATGKKVAPMFPENKLTESQLGKVLLCTMVFGFIPGVIQMLRLPIGIFGLIDTMLPATVGGLLLLYKLRGGKNMVLIFITIIYMIYYFIYYIGGTLFIYSIYLIMAPTVVYILERKKIPYVALIVTVVAVMPIYLSRHSYRNVGLLGSSEVKLATGLSILENEYSNISIDHWKELYYAEQEDKNVDNRTEGVSYLGQIVKKINEGSCGYLYGRTLIWFPTMVLPHFLIPFRPGQNMGDQEAIYYGLKDASWQASINFPMLCEFYANFGYAGMVILMFINGLLIVWFVQKFNEGRGDTNLLLFIFMVSKIIIVESNISLSYGAILQIMAICWLIKKYRGDSGIA